MSNGAIGPLDYSDLGVCTDCIKGKQTNIRKVGARRSSGVLDLVYTDICGPFLKASWNDHKYFITFTDDYSRYEYLYLIYEKSQSLDMFKIYKPEVKNQQNRKIKAVRFDRGGEYYGRCDGSGRCPGPFANFLEECGIVAQYTMSRTPHQNGVAERRNRTLKDMVRSMIAHTTLSESLWSETLKTAVYLLNRVPSKTVIKIP